MPAIRCCTCTNFQSAYGIAYDINRTDRHTEHRRPDCGAVVRAPQKHPPAHRQTGQSAGIISGQPVIQGEVRYHIALLGIGDTGDHRKASSTWPACIPSGCPWSVYWPRTSVRTMRRSSSISKPPGSSRDWAMATRISTRKLRWEPGEMPSQAQWQELARLRTDNTLFVWEAKPIDAIAEKMQAS